jgi:hypothetical protein
MLNIVEKYSVDTAVESEDGVVAIEYVIVAAALVAGSGGSVVAVRRHPRRRARRRGRQILADPSAGGG